jgi:hypothetical protein
MRTAKVLIAFGLPAALPEFSPGFPLGRLPLRGAFQARVLYADFQTQRLKRLSYCSLLCHKPSIAEETNCMIDEDAGPADLTSFWANGSETTGTLTLDVQSKYYRPRSNERPQASAERPRLNQTRATDSSGEPQ